MQFTYYNERGDTAEISPDSIYTLIDYSGLEAGTVEIQTGHGYDQNGDTCYGVNLKSRVVTLKFDNICESYADQALHRRVLESVFNPALGGVLYITSDNGSYRMDCRIAEGLVISGERTPAYQEYEVSLYSPDYAVKSAIQRSVKMVGFQGGLTLPFGLPLSLGTQGDIAEIYYSGDVDAPLLIEFRGPATEPKVIKQETGETITIDAELADGETLWIDTTPQKLNVYTQIGNVKTAAFQKIDPASDFFLLTNGDNTLEFHAASGSPEVYLHYYDLYLGV